MVSPMRRLSGAGVATAEVTLSPDRFSNLVISAASLSVDLRGGVGETVTVTVVVEGTVVVHEVRIGATHVETLVVKK